MTQQVVDEESKEFNKSVAKLKRALFKGKADVGEVIFGLDILSSGRSIEPVKGSAPWANSSATYGYPEGFRILSIDEQLTILKKIFPKLNASSNLNKLEKNLPEGAEGWALIPKPDKIGNNYYQAMAMALEILAKTRHLDNYHKDKLSQGHLRLPQKTAQLHKYLHRQTGDYWAFPFQFGKKWAGYSFGSTLMVPQVRFLPKEFGLGIYELAILLLTHPKRLAGEPGSKEIASFSFRDAKQELGLSCGGYCMARIGGDSDCDHEISDFWFYFQYVNDKLHLSLLYPSLNPCNYSGIASAILI